MVKRRHITRGGKPAPAPVKKVVRKAVDEDEIDEVDDELDDEVEVDVEEEVDVDDEEEEEEDEDEEPAPVSRRVSRKVVAEEVADEDEEPAPVKKATKPVAPPAKPVKAPAPAVIKSVDTVIAENVFTQLMESLEEGKSIVITKVKDNKWQISSGAAVKFAGSKISNTDFWNEVISPEFREWHKKWLAMTYDQKLKYAKKVGAKWEQHADPRTNLMRLMPAVRAKEGIKKYKDEYRTRAQRATLRAG